MTILRLLLGDQLTESIATLTDCDQQSDVVLLCEVWDEATYVPHHQKKMVFIFSAMRHFAAHLRRLKYRVDYVKLDDPHNQGSFAGELTRAVARHFITEVVVTHPGEYRVLMLLQDWSRHSGIKLQVRADTRFLCSLAEFNAWAQPRKQYRMELFYRRMRQAHNILMDGDQPVGGQWNYDHANRKSPPNRPEEHALTKFRVDKITREVMQLVSEKFSDHFGAIKPFFYAVTRSQALTALAAL